MAFLKPAPRNNTITTASVAQAAKDSYINKSAINPTTFNEEFGILASYVSGANLYVDYYRRRIPYINKQSSTTAIILEASSADVSFDLIKEMEIKLDSPIELVIDSDTQEAIASGTCIIYHGIKPNVGDIFFAKIADEVGIFTINNLIALSIHRGTHYKAEFNLYSFMDIDVKDRLDASVRETLHFDKQAFFTSEAALLTTDSYTYLKDLTALKDTLIQRYITLFYDKNYETIIHPDKKIDALLIDFVRKRISLDDTRHRIAQVSNHYTSDFDSTIWKALLSRSVSELKYINADTYFFTHHLWDSAVSSYDTLPIILPVNKDTVLDPLRIYQQGSSLENYVFSHRLYLALINFFDTGKHQAHSAIIDMPDFEWLPETLVYQSIEAEYVDMSTVTPYKNDMELSDLEYIVYRYITKQSVTQEEFRAAVITPFPYTKMTKADKVYWFIIILTLIDWQLMEIN